MSESLAINKPKIDNARIFPYVKEAAAHLEISYQNLNRVLRGRPVQWMTESRRLELIEGYRAFIREFHPEVIEMLTGSAPATPETSAA